MTANGKKMILPQTVKLSSVSGTGDDSNINSNINSIEKTLNQLIKQLKTSGYGT